MFNKAPTFTFINEFYNLLKLFCQVILTNIEGNLQYTQSKFDTCFGAMPFVFDSYPQTTKNLRIKTIWREIRKFRRGCYKPYRCVLYYLI